MKKNGVKRAATNYKNGVKIETVHSDIFARSVSALKLENAQI